MNWNRICPTHFSVKLCNFPLCKCCCQTKLRRCLVGRFRSKSTCAFFCMQKYDLNERNMVYRVSIRTFPSAQSYIFFHVSLHFLTAGLHSYFAIRYRLAQFTTGWRNSLQVGAIHYRLVPTFYFKKMLNLFHLSSSHELTVPYLIK